MNETVQVLLSAYNGEKYIEEQLDSILGQKNVKAELLIRDDGSIDGTRDILRRYEELHDNVSVIYGENLGVINSFFSLMQSASKEVEYIAFSDQDDVWLPEKLSRAVSLLAGNENKPMVYCSAKRLVNEKLEPLPEAITYQNVRAEFGNALVENMCTGCTCVINKEMLCLLTDKVPEFTVMHDFWIYMAGTCFGTVIYDENSYILYRQHGKNELGAASTIVENYKRRIKGFIRHRGQLHAQAAEFLRAYGDMMPDENRELVQDFLEAKKDRKTRRRLLNSGLIFRQRKSDDNIFRWLMRANIL